MPIPTTDLALEAADIFFSGRKNSTSSLPGFRRVESLQEGYPITSVAITSPQAAQAIGKPMGRYVTMDLQPYSRRQPQFFHRAVRCLSDQLQNLLPKKQGSILVVGLGNRAMTADAVGPQALRHLLVTRHLLTPGSPLSGLRPVAALATGVLAETGVETLSLIQGTASQIRPCALVVIDALAAHSPQRLCTCLQLSDTGLVPGSGVGNHRQAINAETLGIPVIAIGLPTVISTAALTGKEDAGGLFVTPRDIDQRVRELGRLIGYGINLALQRSLTLEDIMGLLG